MMPPTQHVCFHLPLIDQSRNIPVIMAHRSHGSIHLRGNIARILWEIERTSSGNGAGSRARAHGQKKRRECCCEKSTHAIIYVWALVQIARKKDTWFFNDGIVVWSLSAMFSNSQHSRVHSFNKMMNPRKSEEVDRQNLSMINHG